MFGRHKFYNKKNVKLKQGRQFSILIYKKSEYLLYYKKYLNK